jgi:hypothetical protein
MEQEQSSAASTRPINVNTERVTASGNMCNATLDITASKLLSEKGSDNWCARRSSR